MRIACWISEATNTHTGYVILIPFLLQQWYHERASMLRDTYMAVGLNFCNTKPGAVQSLFLVQLKQKELD